MGQTGGRTNEQTDWQQLRIMRRDCAALYWRQHNNNVSHSNIVRDSFGVYSG